MIRRVLTEKRIFYKAGVILLVLVLPALFWSCSTTGPDTIFRNQNLVFEPGYPSFSVSSYGYYNNDNRSIITVTTDIVPSSLITYRNDSLFSAKESAGFTVTYEIIKKNKAEGGAINFTERKNLVFDGTKDPEQVEPVKLERDFEVPSAGVYEVYVSVADEKSGNSKTLTDTVIIPDLSSEQFGLSNVSVSALDSSSIDEGYIPITTYDITGKYEEIRFESQLTSDISDDSLQIYSEVIKYRSDNRPAERMSAPTYAISTLQREGIDYDHSEVLYSQERSIRTGDKVFTYRVRFPVPEIGNYRYQVTVKNTRTGKTLVRAFDFGVKRKGFPFVRSARDLARPLYYLMDDKDYEKMLAIEDSDSLKRAVDEFWIRHIENANRARDVIRLYYTRVEEANKYYSSYKEGWKTDFGMIYVLFGPPSYSRTTFNYVQWSYSTNQYDSRYNYVFRQERRQSEVFPFKVYILDRSDPQINENEYLVVDQWLSGDVLQEQ